MKQFIVRFLLAGLLIIGGFNLHLNSQSITLELKNVENQQNNSSGKIEPTAFVGESFILQATIHDTKNNDNDLSIDGIASFSIAGTMRSSNISFINGRQSVSHTYSYTLIPHNEGIFTLGPANIQGKRGNNNISSNNVIVKVIKRPAGSKKQIDSSQQENIAEVFCELKPQKDTIFVGEPLEIVASIYTRGPILEVGLDAPTFHGFLLKEVLQAKTHQENKDGKEYNVTEKKLILTPLQSGERKINSLLVRYAVRSSRKRARDFFDHTFFDDFFPSRVEQKTVFSNDLTVNVLDLPPYKGMVNGVGEFNSIKASVSKTNLHENEAVTLQITVSGKSNFDQVTSPVLSLPQGFKSYESKSFVEEDYSQDFVPGKKTFEYVVQIPKAGDWKIPSQSFTYFDTSSKRYQTIQSEPLDITIVSSDSSGLTNHEQTEESHEIAQEEIIKNTRPSLETEVHFIYEDVDATSKEAPAIPWWAFIIVLFTMSLLLSSSAFKELKKLYFKIFRISGKRRLEEFETKLNTLIKKNSAENLYQLLISFLAVKFDVPENVVTHDWIIQQLERDGIPDEKINEFMDYLNECASLLFITQQKSIPELQNILKRGKYWLIFLGK